MIWVVALEGVVIKGGPNKAVPPQEAYSPSSKTEDNLITAPFPGWSPERQERVNNFNIQEAYKRLPSLLQEWNSVRWYLNDYYERTDKSAVCERKEMRGEPCPQEHPLNEKILEYRARFESTKDPWDFVFLEDYIEDAKNLARALQDEEYARKLKANLEPAQIAPPKEDLLKKPFRWDDGIITPFDGNGWSNVPVATSVAYEYNPTIVEIGNADTLVAAFNVYPCNAWCSVSHTNECIVVARSLDQGNTWNLWFCIHNPNYNVGEAAIGEEDYRKIVTVAFTSDYYWPDYDVGAFTFHFSNPSLNYSTWVDVSTTSTVTPYVTAEFNWGQSGCAGQWPSTCSCTAFDNWWFIGMNKAGGGVRIARSTDCGNSWGTSYDGPARTGSAYNNNQIMLETTNDPRGSSSVCSSSNGGDNTIQAVYDWKTSSTNHRIEHLYTDASMSWGGSWTSTTILSGSSYPINQPWLAVSRSLTTTGTRAVVLYERQWSSSDGDILGLYASGIPPSGWTTFTLDASTIDSRTPTVHTDARWQWCPGLTATSASYFHTSFYHKCSNTTSHTYCTAPLSSYNNTFRVAVLRAPWTSPTSWGREYCPNNGTYADYIATPPPPSFNNGGLWQNWWQINGTTYKVTPTAGATWWYGTLWVYQYSSTDFDLYFSVLNCALGEDDELAVGEKDKERENIRIEGRMLHLPEFSIIYSPSGRKVFEGKGWTYLNPGVYFVRTGSITTKIAIK
jgi:hypothetical protein